MGKTQSKRSVDITTEGKKGPEEEVTGKLEKIDDLDQKQVNGDAAPQDNIEAEKKDADESENDKDLTTEKSAEAAQGGGDGEQNNTTATGTETPKGEESAAANEGEKVVGASGTEEISPLADESSKKPKKEKVKKKWSFRSISFGKKDKQKPAKAEEGAGENAEAMNGETATTVEKTEGTTESMKKDEAGEEIEEAKAAEKLENGDATEKELNGQQTPTTTPTDEKVVTNENTTKITATADSNEVAVNETNQTEKKAEAIEAVTAADAAPVVVSNGTATEKNGIDVSSSVDDMKEAVIDNAANVVEATAAVVDKIKSIPSVVNDGCDVAPHQNGTSADGEAVEPKTQTEVIIQNVTTPTENLATTTLSSAHTLSISSIPLDPNSQSQQKNSDASSNKNENKISIDASIAVVARVADESETSAPAPPVAVVDDANHSEPPKQEPGAGNCESVRTPAVQSDCQQPPPLPVSPPPSQVSVFAFTDQTHVGEVMATPETEEPPTPSLLAAEPENDIIANAAPTAATVAEDDAIEIMPTVPSTTAEDSKVEGETVEEQTPQQTEPETTEVNCGMEETSKANAPEITPDKTEEFVVAKAVVDEVTRKAVEMIQLQNEQEVSPKPELESPQQQQQQQQQADDKTDVADVVAEQIKEEEINCVISSIDVNAPTSVAVEALPTITESDSSNPRSSPGVISEHESASKCDLTVPHTTATVIAPFHGDTQEQDEHNEGEEKMREKEDCSLLGVKDIEKLTVSNKDDDRGDNDNGSISPSKEITNALDSKENAAVEITTQDLPVTCE